MHVYGYTRILTDILIFFASPSLNGINLSKNSIYFTGEKQTQRERGAVRNAALSRWNATPASWTSPPQSPFGAKAARLAKWTLNRVSFCGSDGREKKKTNARPKRLQTSSLLKKKNRRKIKYSGDITGTACWLCEVIKQFLFFFFFPPSGFFFFPVNKIGSSKSESWTRGRCTEL